MSHLNILFDRYASIGTVMHYILVISLRLWVAALKLLNLFVENNRTRNIVNSSWSESCPHYLTPPPLPPSFFVRANTRSFCNIKFGRPQLKTCAQLLVHNSTTAIENLCTSETASRLWTDDANCTTAAMFEK